MDTVAKVGTRPVKVYKDPDPLVFFQSTGYWAMDFHTLLALPWLQNEWSPCHHRLWQYLNMVSVDMILL